MLQIGKELSGNNLYRPPSLQAVSYAIHSKVNKRHSCLHFLLVPCLDICCESEYLSYGTSCLDKQTDIMTEMCSVLQHGMVYYNIAIIGESTIKWVAIGLDGTHALASNKFVP